MIRGVPGLEVRAANEGGYQRQTTRQEEAFWGDGNLKVHLDGRCTTL